jgi:tryptophan synthase alpha chain
MNRIDKLFRGKKNNILSIYFTAGYPALEDTAMIIEELSKNGADIIEIGIPFSDSVVDGEVIQNSNKKAIENGMTLRKLFEQLRGIRKRTSMPLIMMGYLNQMLQFGEEEFCKKCMETGIDGIIVPDLPPEEYEKEYKKLFSRYGLYNILLITPQTSEARIRKIDAKSKGFIYAVSSASTTGEKKYEELFTKNDLKMQGMQEEYFKRIKNMKLRNSLMIGFGISGYETFSRACIYAQGAIIGSAFINSITGSMNLKTDIKKFMDKIKGPINGKTIKR